MLVVVFFFVGVKPYEDPIPEEFFEIPMVDETPDLDVEETSKQRIMQMRYVRKVKKYFRRMMLYARPSPTKNYNL